MKFTGEQLDPTGLYYLRAQQYDPTLGRFSALDPLPSPLVYVSSYAYADDRPTVLVDPSGMGATAPADGGRCFAGEATSGADEESGAPARCLASYSEASRSCTPLGRAVLANPRISLVSYRRHDIERDLCTRNVIHWEVKRGLIQIAKVWHLVITVLKTGHHNDGPHGHYGGWAADIGNYTSSNYSRTTRFMSWLNRHHKRLIIRQIIGANERLVYPHYYDRATLNDHKDHVHIGWGYWP